MTDTPDYLADLLDGLATSIADAGIGSWSGFDGPAYASTDTGIGIGVMPEQCTRAIALAPYLTVDPEPMLTDQIQRIQVRYRGQPDDVMDALSIGKQIFQLWQGIFMVTYGTCSVSAIARINGNAPMGIDGQRRFDYVDNYQIYLNTPDTAYRD